MQYKIFELAKQKRNVIILTKDEDLVNICLLKIPPPYIVWITIGNIKNEQLFSVIKNKFVETIETLINSKYPYIQLEY